MLSWVSVEQIQKAGQNQTVLPGFWRKRWDSNPRAREGYLISSQARYDHFDTLPYCGTLCIISQVWLKSKSFLIVFVRACKWHVLMIE